MYDLVYFLGGVPDEYLCPITREIMKDPVIAAGKPLSLFTKHKSAFV